MHTFSKKKPKPWTNIEEEALAKAWIDVSGYPITRNQQRFDSFWKRCLEHFEAQLGNTERTVHQLNSKWKDMNEKINKFNALYSDKLANRQIDQSDADVLSMTIIEYRKLYKNKAFPHQRAWEVVKDDPKWNAIYLKCTHVQSMKRPMTSDSNTYTSSSDAQFSNDHNEDDKGFLYEEPEKPQQKEKKSASSSTSTEQQQKLLKIVSEFSSINKEDMEDKKRYRAEKLRLMKEEKEKKMLILEQELRMMQQKEMDKDMQFFLMPHDNLTGAALNAVLARKRKIRQHWGWE